MDIVRQTPPERRKRKRAIARLLSVASVVMVVGAAGVALYPFATDLRAEREQKSLKIAFGKSEQVKQAYRERRIAEGSPLTRIQIPRIGVDAVVVEGTSDRALAAGAGHYPETPLPGETGNVAIAGHRTMNGKPFHDLDKLKPGDVVVLITPFARHTYEMVPAFGGHGNPWVTTPTDWSVIEQGGEALLTLTTCHPKGSDRQRLVARAKLVKSENLP